MRENSQVQVQVSLSTTKVRDSVRVLREHAAMIASASDQAVLASARLVALAGPSSSASEAAARAITATKRAALAQVRAAIGVAMLSILGELGVD